MFVEAREKISLKKIIFSLDLRIAVSLALLTSIFSPLGMFFFALIFLSAGDLRLPLLSRWMCLMTSFCFSAPSLPLPQPRPLAFSIFPLSPLPYLLSNFYFSLSISLYHLSLLIFPSLCDSYRTSLLFLNKSFSLFILFTPSIFFSSHFAFFLSSP